MQAIPEDVRVAAEKALREANIKAHMLAEPTDPIECIARAIMAERERCAGKLEAMVKTYLPGGPGDLKSGLIVGARAIRDPQV